MPRSRFSLALRSSGRLLGFGAARLRGLGMLRGKSGFALCLGLQLLRARRELLCLGGVGVGLLAMPGGLGREPLALGPLLRRAAPKKSIASAMIAMAAATRTTTSIVSMRSTSLFRSY